VLDDITDSAFPDGFFDVILCSEVIEHVEESQRAFAEMYRLLSPRGVLILSTPQRFSPLEVCSKVAFLPGIIDIVRRIYKEPIQETGHINLMTRRTLCAELSAAGFAIQEMHAGGVYLPVIAEIFGEYALRMEHAIEPRLRNTRFEWLLWTQYVVATSRS
jgi:2-polyprenyl-3-methyl-5-hydroxy-6-metoxy-1,4-benzoquinol methylase